MSNNIKSIMKQRDWTVERLAAQMTDKNGKVGITQSAASQIINGNPTLAKIKEIACIMGVAPELLVGDKDSTFLIGYVNYKGEDHVFKSLQDVHDFTAANPLPSSLESEPNE